MKGRTIIIKALGNRFWEWDSKKRNARGKKRSWCKAEAKQASRRFRRQNNSNVEEDC